MGYHNCWSPSTFSTSITLLPTQEFCCLKSKCPNIQGVLRLAPDILFTSPHTPNHSHPEENAVCVFISWAYCILAYLHDMVFLYQEYPSSFKNFLQHSSLSTLLPPVLDPPHYYPHDPSMFFLHPVKTSIKQFLYCVVNSFLKVMAMPSLNISSVKVGVYVCPVISIQKLEQRRCPMLCLSSSVVRSY